MDAPNDSCTEASDAKEYCTTMTGKVLTYRYIHFWMEHCVLREFCVRPNFRLRADGCARRFDDSVPENIFAAHSAIVK